MAINRTAAAAATATATIRNLEICF